MGLYSEEIRAIILVTKSIKRDQKANVSAISMKIAVFQSKL